MQQENLPGLDVPETKPVDTTHLEERRLFEVMLNDYPWVGSYLALLNEGWYWRDACYIAWKATPKSHRQPTTLEELADILGISKRAFSERLQKNPAIKVRAAKLVASQIYEKVDDVVDALMQSASDPSYKHHPDRKLALEMAGLYVPKQALDLGIAEKDEEDLSGLSKEELVRRANMGVGDE